MGESFPFQKSDLLWRRKAILLAHLEPLNELRRKASFFDCVRRNAVLFKIFKGMTPLQFRCKTETSPL